MCKGRKLNGAVLAPAPPRGDLFRNRPNSEDLRSPLTNDFITHQRSRNAIISLQHTLQFERSSFTSYCASGNWRPLSLDFTIQYLADHLLLESKGKKGAIKGRFPHKIERLRPFPPRPRPLILRKSGTSLTKLRSSAPRPSSAPRRGNIDFPKSVQYI